MHQILLNTRIAKAQSHESPVHTRHQNRYKALGMFSEVQGCLEQPFAQPRATSILAKRSPWPLGSPWASPEVGLCIRPWPLGASQASPGVDLQMRPQ